MNILIVKTSAIGDVTHTLPALAALRREFPGAEIDWLVEEAAADILRGAGDIDRILVSRRRYWWREIKAGPRRAFAALKDFFAFVRRLRRRRYDLLFDFQNLLKSSVFVFLARAEKKIGYGRGMEHAEFSYIFLNHRVKPVSMDIHAATRELMLLEALGIDGDRSEIKLRPGVDAVKRVLRVLGKERSDRPLVAINPVATWESKLWREEGFVAVARGLADSGCRVVFTGGPGDCAVVSRIIAGAGEGAEDLCGRTSLAELTALYSICDLVISTDTGPMHIAAAAGPRVLAIFGSTAPWRTGPVGEKNRVIRLDLECSPCLKKTCPRGNHACMEGISAEMVLVAARDMLHQTGGGVIPVPARPAP